MVVNCYKISTDSSMEMKHGTLRNTMSIVQHTETITNNKNVIFINGLHTRYNYTIYSGTSL